MPIEEDRIVICDQAGGIPRRVVRKLGNTLVSTKGDKGLGLGVTIVAKLVARMNGQSRIATATTTDVSQLARLGIPTGTIFSICLPSTKQSGKVKRKRPSLCVDDDYQLVWDQLELGQIA